MTIPDNVLKFEIALYASLLLDTVSAALQAMGANDGDPTAYGAVNIINALVILGFVFLVGIAARRRKNWARMLLLAALILAAMSLLIVLNNDGLSFTSALDIVSVGLSAYGMRASFGGDARGWFTG